MLITKQLLLKLDMLSKKIFEQLNKIFEQLFGIFLSNFLAFSEQILEWPSSHHMSLPAGPPLV